MTLLTWRRGAHYAGNGLALLLVLWSALFGLSPAQTVAAREVVRESRGVTFTAPVVAPFGVLVSVLSRNVRPGLSPGGGGGGGGSSPDAPSTVTYSPAAHPSWLVTGPADLPQAWVTSAKGARNYVSDVLITDQGSATANMNAVNSAIVTAAALAGDKRIRLTLGLTYQGTCRLLKQANSTGWIDIEAATAPCAEGVRATVAQMAGQPRFHSVGNDNPTVSCQRGADRYRLMGIKHTCATTTGIVYFVLHINAREAGMVDEVAQSLLEHCPRDIIVDRNSVEGTADPSGVGRCKNGVTLNGIRVALVNSIVTGQYNDNDENHGVIAFNTPGPIKIVDNFIDSGSIPVMFGGTGSGLGASNGRPRDIEIRRNHLSHPEAWCPASGGGANKYSLKGLFELKNADRVLVEGNVMERCPSGAQTGMAIVIKSAGDGFGASTGMGTSNATLRYNVIRNVRHALNVDGFGDPIESGVLQCNRVSVYHNLFYDVGTVIANGSPSGNPDSASGKMILPSTGATDYFNVRFNTFVSNLLNQAVMLPMSNVAAGKESEWFDVSDNVLMSPSWSNPVFYDGGFFGDAAMNKYALNSSQWDFNRNFIVGVATGYLGNIPTGTGNVNPGSAESPTLASLLTTAAFVNEPADNYRLAAGSPGKGIGSGGADPGADIDTVDLATAGVV